MENNNQEKYSTLDKKGTMIVINGRDTEVYEKRLTFEQVVRLAMDEYKPDDNVVYTVSYSKGNRPDKGMMVSGDEISVKKGMVINVAKTTRS